MENFSTNSLALEFADTKFNADDYIRDYEQFKILKANGKI
ncbi:WxcM-like domain-containing protein [Bacteroides thetaiotaomicron]